MAENKSPEHGFAEQMFNAVNDFVSVSNLISGWA
jgi:hypothetical protein